MPLTNNASALQDKPVGFVIPQFYYSVKTRKMQIMIQDFSWQWEIIWLKRPLCGRWGGEIELELSRNRNKARTPGEGEGGEEGGIFLPYHSQSRTTQEKWRTQTKWWYFFVNLADISCTFH